MEDDVKCNLSSFIFVSERLARKKQQEGPDSFRKQDIELAFVHIDSQLRQLQEAQNLQQVRRYVPDIRDQLFQIYNRVVHRLDILQFASHSRGDRTPLNSSEC